MLKKVDEKQPSTFHLQRQHHSSSKLLKELEIGEWQWA
jgi:hypothetical protein